LACIFISLALCGCSNENSSSDTKKADDGKKTEKPLTQSLVQPVLPPGVSKAPENSDQQVPALPTRSELRVLSEQAKATENEAKIVIEQFDANLNNREARAEAEAKFKSVLPEYKEKMLQLGKAKLKEAN
ncbi:MAG: hypothetical protein QX196_12390, partial [Methylococcaceae bacterium]